MSTLQCDSLTARYEESEESNVFTNLTMRVDHAEIVALFGPSGCGKSTLLRIIAGLETPAAGAVFLDDDDVSKWPAHKRRVGLVFQLIQ